jgi:hypothetical protein
MVKPGTRGNSSTDPSPITRLVINLCYMLLENAACSALSKGLKYAVTPVVMPVEDNLCRVKNITGALPTDTAEEVQQETVRTLTGSCKPMDNLTGVGTESQ